ncbi:hypothetical protein N9928_01885, partial [bacterium]|nr:hypothetical protein [bacterium]
SEFDIYGDKISDTDANGVSRTYQRGTFGVIDVEESGKDKRMTTDISYDRFNRESLRSTAFTDDAEYKVENKQYQLWDAADQLLRIDVVGTYEKNSVTKEDRVSTSYTYDADGNRRTELLVSNKGYLVETDETTLRNVNYIYDSQSRLKSFTDTSLPDNTITFNYGYDANGNRSTITKQQGAYEATQYSYTYDNANRIKKEVVTANNVQLKELSFTYDLAGRREQQTRSELFVGGLIDDAVTSYAYYRNGRIRTQSTTIKGVTILERIWKYDRAGQEVFVWDNSLRLGIMAWLSTGENLYANFDDSGVLLDEDLQVDADDLSDDAASWLTGNVNQTKRDSAGRTVYTLNVGIAIDVKSTYEFDPIGTQNAKINEVLDDRDQQQSLQETSLALDKAGRTLVSVVYTRDDDRTTTYFSYSDLDGQQSFIDAVKDDDPGSTGFVYNSQRQLISLNLGAIEEGDSPELRSFDYDNDGNIVSKVRLPAEGSVDPTVSLRYVYQNGKIVGQYSLINPSSNVASLANGRDFDSVQSSGSSLPTSTSYITADGSSLRALAAQYYGSPDLWYVIAEANGMTTGAAPMAGTRLVIPGTVANAYHNADTYALYSNDAIVGSTLPNIEIPDNTCALVGAIIAIVVISILAVVATVLTAGALAAPLAAGGVSAATAILGSVVAGATIAFAASVATQLVLVGAGLQREFDWESVAVDSLVGGIGGAVAGLGAFAATAKSFANLSKTATNLLKVVKVVGSAALEVATEAAAQQITREKGEGFDALGLVLAGAAEGVAAAVDGVVDAAQASIKALRKTKSAGQIAESLSELTTAKTALKNLKSSRKQAKAEADFVKLKPTTKFDGKEKEIELSRLKQKIKR